MTDSALSASEMIRLVCPACDTVHRVKSVTLGKLYRCKKCRAGLITMTPARACCAACGFSLPPAHVEVSRLLTCPRCPHAPLLQLDFPPPALIAAEGGEIVTGVEYANTAGVMTAAQGEDTESRGLATVAPPVRSIQALRQVLNDLQRPLLMEIRESRRSIPLWLAAIISLPLLALVGALYASLLAARSDRQALPQIEAECRLLREQLMRMRKGMADTQRAAADLQRACDRLAHEAAEKSAALEERNEDVLKLKEALEKVHTRAKQMELKLRSLGYDPDVKIAIQSEK